MIRLSELLRNCSSRKYKNGYKKYLASLDYVEYEKLFKHYFEILTTLLIKYESKEHKFLSKDWFKARKVNKMYDRLYRLFLDSNHVFLLIATEKMKRINDEKEKIYQKIEELKQSIQNVYNTELLIEIPPTKYDLINLLILFMTSIYSEKELRALLDELKKYK